MAPDRMNIEDLRREVEKLRHQLQQFHDAWDEEKVPGGDLLASRRDVLKLLEAVPVGIFVIDRQGKPFYANEAAQQLLGKGIAPTSGIEGLAEVYRAHRAGGGNEYPASEMPIARALKGEKSMILDMEIHHPEKVIPLQVWGAPIYDRQGNLAYAVAAFSDISDRIHAERRLGTQYSVARALAESHTLEDAVGRILQPICETADWDIGVVWTVDQEKATLRCVEAWSTAPQAVSQFLTATRNLAHGPRHGLPGRVWSERQPLWIADVAGDPSFTRAAAAQAGGIHSGCAVPLLSEQHVVGVIEFFSRRVRERDEATLQMMVAFGNQIGQFMERKVAENELHRAKEAAELAARSKAEFLSIMSHEIRTPLNAILGMTELLSETGMTAAQREYARTIRLSGETLLTVINDILDFSKIDSLKLVLEEHPFEIVSCIEDAFDLVAQQSEAKHIDLVYSIDPDVPPVVKGDVTRLRQILVNLIGNALKFTEKGEIVVSVKQVGRRTGASDLRFSVRDTGIGIPADRIDRLFKPFSQADVSDTRKFGGTGLGLAICSRLVGLMGGTIGVESEPGRGSEFFFTLSMAPSPGSPVALTGVDISGLKGKRVLLVDDNKLHLRTLSRQLTEWGMVPFPFASGREALGVLTRGEHFDLALVDMQLPDMDGLELGRQIQGLSLESPFPLILLSSLAHQEEVMRSSQGIFSSYVPKPVKRSQLFDVTVEVLSGAGRSRVTPGTRPKLDATLGARLPLRILVAEDNPANQKLMLFILQQLGYRPDCAGNGLEVLDALEHRRYDLIFMDVEMPEMDGFEATQRIVKRWPAGERPAIVGTTAFALEEDQGKCADAGMDGYITKPIRFEDIQNVLERWGAERAALASPPEGVPPATMASDVLTAAKSDPTLIAQLIELYRNDYKTVLSEMTRAMEQQDGTKLRSGAHRLKGASLNLGLTDIADLCKRIEKGAAVNKPDEVQQVLALLKQNYEPVCVQLDRLLRATRSGHPE